MDPERLQRLLDRIRDLRSGGASDSVINQHLQNADNLPVSNLSEVQAEARNAGLTGPRLATDVDTAATGRSATRLSSPEERQRQVQQSMQQDRASALRDRAFQALRQGVPREQIESQLNRMSGGQVSSIETLQQLAAGESPRRQQALQRVAERDPSPASMFGRDFAQGATFGLSDEISGLVNELVPGGPSGREAMQESRQRTADRQLLAPGASLSGQIAGGVATGVGGGGLLGRLAGQPTGNASTALGGLLRGAGPRTTPTRQLANAAGRGTAVGGAEGLAFGAGTAEGGLLERLEQGARNVPASAVGGGLLGTIIGIPGAVGTATRRTRRAGEILADDIAELGARGQRRLPSQLREAADEKAQRARQMFQELEEGGNASTTIELQELFINDPVARSALSQNARQALEENQALTFTQIDDAATNLKRTADAFKRGDPNVRAEDVRRAAEAFDQLDQRMRSSLEGFDEAKQLWGEKARAMRALNEGRDLWGSQADDIRSTLQDLPEGEAREFFRQGLMNEAIRELERFRGSWFDPPSAAKTFFKRGRGFEEELRLMFPSDEAFEEFSRRVDVISKSASAAEKAQVTAQALAFLGGGTSLFGRLLGG